MLLLLVPGSRRQEYSHHPGRLDQPLYLVDAHVQTRRYDLVGHPHLHRLPDIHPPAALGHAHVHLVGDQLRRKVKYGEVYLKAYANILEIQRGLEDYFLFYNHLRPHQALGYRTLAEEFHGEQGVEEEEYSGRRSSPGTSAGRPPGAPGFSLDSAPILSKELGPPHCLVEFRVATDRSYHMNLVQKLDQVVRNTHSKVGLKVTAQIYHPILEPPISLAHPHRN